MERLTEWRDGEAHCNHCGISCGYCGDLPCIFRSAMMTTLAKYEDAEEQGLLIRLPCKVGDTVWVIITSYVYGELGDPPETRHHIESRPFELSMLENFSKTVFITREEAEAALKED